MSPLHSALSLADRVVLNRFFFKNRKPEQGYVLLSLRPKLLKTVQNFQCCLALYLSKKHLIHSRYDLNCFNSFLLFLTFLQFKPFPKPCYWPNRELNCTRIFPHLPPRRNQHPDWRGSMVTSEGTTYSLLVVQPLFSFMFLFVCPVLGLLSASSLSTLKHETTWSPLLIEWLFRFTNSVSFPFTFRISCHHNSLTNQFYYEPANEILFSTFHTQFVWSYPILSCAEWAVGWIRILDSLDFEVQRNANPKKDLLS